MSANIRQNSNTPFFKDWFLLGLTTGMASAVLKTTINTLAQKVGLATEPYGNLAGNMVLGKRKNTWWSSRKPQVSRDERIVGALSDVVFGGIFGVITSYIYSKTPPGNELAKGMLGGAAIWALTFTVPNQMMVSRLLPKQMITLLGMDIIYGAAQGALIGRYGAKLTRQSHPLLVKSVSDKGFDRGRMMVRRGRQSLM